MSSPWKCSVDQKQLAPKTMQLAVVVTEESGVICRDFGADLHLIEGSGLKHRWGEDAHLHQRIHGAGAEVFKGPNPLIAHPGAELLGGPVGEGIPQAGLGRFSGDGLQPQASAGIEQHREQRLAAADRRDP